MHTNLKERIAQLEKEGHSFAQAQELAYVERRNSDAATRRHAQAATMSGTDTELPCDRAAASAVVLKRDGRGALVVDTHATALRLSREQGITIDAAQNEAVKLSRAVTRGAHSPRESTRELADRLTRQGLAFTDAQSVAVTIMRDGGASLSDFDAPAYVASRGAGASHARALVTSWKSK